MARNSTCEFKARFPEMRGDLPLKLLVPAFAIVSDCQRLPACTLLADRL